MTSYISATACPAGWVDYNLGSIKFGMCYSNARYRDAVNLCRNWGGKTYEPRDPSVQIPWTGGSYWIGVTDTHREGR